MRATKERLLNPFRADMVDIQTPDLEEGLHCGNVTLFDSFPEFCIFLSIYPVSLYYLFIVPS